MDILLDSGAFSIFNREGRIDLNAYIGFVKANESLLYRYINLDVIPGNGGKPESRPEAIEAAAAASDANQQKMKEAGLNPIPVFHQDENFRWLEKYLADGEDYIGISPSLRARPNDKLTWLRDCSKLLCSQGRPLVRTHGLGETSTLICHEFPFTTVDSRRWFLAAAYGQIPVPIQCGGKPDYTLDPRTVFMTERSRGRPNHIDARDNRERVDRFLAEFGVDAEQCRDGRDGMAHRCQIWLKYLAGVEASSGVQIFHVTNLSPGQSEALDTTGSERRLVSYYFLKDRSDTALAKYMAAYVPHPRALNVSDFRKPI